MAGYWRVWLSCGNRSGEGVRLVTGVYGLVAVTGRERALGWLLACTAYLQ